MSAFNTILGTVICTEF